MEKELGPTANGGTWVEFTRSYLRGDSLFFFIFIRINIDLYEDLLRMGFPKGAAVEALKQVNNNLDQALQVCIQF
jgi:hypothetical protein